MKRAYLVQGAVAAPLLLGSSVALTQQNGQGQGATPEDMLAEDGGVLSSLQPGSAERIGAGTAFNPSISVILDGVYKNTFSDDGHQPGGFEAVHGHDHGHAHGMENGFQLRETEFVFEASVDPYFDAFAALVIDGTESVDLEEAYFTTTSLPWGLQIKGGRFLSDIGYINRQHAHEWDFVDRPLVSEYLFGDHGLQETGVQLNWLLPTPTYLKAGVEALQGESEGVAAYDGGDAFEQATGPRLGTAFLKWGPDLGYAHAAQLGIAGGYARAYQLEDHDDHDGDEHELFWDGDSWFAGVDAIYKYDAGGYLGHGDLTLQAEYFYRNIDVDFREEDDGIVDASFSDTSKQDGAYLQAVYGIAPRWRTGLRAEALGITNDSLQPNEADTGFASFDTSYRYSLNTTFHPSHFSYLRAQVNYADYASDEPDRGHGHEEWSVMLQYNLSLGAHGAHPF